jgi:hypothetical protein
MIDDVKFYGLSGAKKEDIQENWLNGTISEAEKLLRHSYDYFALGPIDLGDEINWNRECKSGVNTPLLFGPWMDYRDYRSYGDFKYFWELPRLQHLVTLSKAYYLTGKEAYAEEAVRQIRGFVEQSPYLLGVNWIMPMEAAIRLVSISWVTAFLRQRFAKDAETCGLIEQIVKSHVNYVVKNYGDCSSANNHLVAEAAGVFIAGVCFSQFERMGTHRQEAYSILCREVIRQHYADGVNKEQAIHYQIFTFNFFLLAGLLGKANNIEFPRQYWQTLENSANFITAVADGDCSIPNIGDSDDGKAVLLSETDYNPIRSALATSAVLFKRRDFKAKAKVFDEMSFWLLGNEGKNEFDALNAEPALAASKFDQGGYYILSGNNGSRPKVVVDCGPLGFESIAAHGHADSLSFVLSAYDRPYFVDPGSYTYIADNPYRDYFRSTQAHNTIVIDGQNQSEIQGPFLWGQKAHSSVIGWVNNEHCDEVVAQHNGYHRLGDPVSCRRAVKLDKRREMITIDDYLEMKTAHKVEQYFHLAPECHLENIDTNTWQITNAGKKVQLIVDSRFNCEVYAGSEDPIYGWFSDAYDRKTPINTLVCRGAFTGSQHFTTTIRLAV